MRVSGLLVITFWLLGCVSNAAPSPSPDSLPAPAPAPSSQPDLVQTLYADNYADGKYFNPWGDFDKSVGDLLSYAFSSNPYDKSQPVSVPVVPNDGSELKTEQQSAKITWAGHASVIIHDGGDVVLTDPHFTERAFLPKRKTPPGVPLGSIPEHAFAVISHNHYDHLDESTVEQLPDDMLWIVPMGLAKWFKKHGRENVRELNWWQSTQHGRWTITAVPAQHWSRRLGQAQNSTLWTGWVLESGDYTYYYAGDTGYFHGFSEIGKKFGPIDVALLPIGAYMPRWFMGYQHVDPAQAYQAFLDLEADYMIPVHWGTFDLAQEPIDQPPKDLKVAVEAQGGDMERVKILAIGEGWHLPAPAGGLSVRVE